jgi:hypothetical protein
MPSARLDALRGKQKLSKSRNRVSELDDLGRQAREVGSELRGRSANLTTEADRRRMQFDPSERIRESSRAAFDEFSEGLDDTVQRVRGRNVGAGRLETGFGVDDEDSAVEFGIQNLNRTIAQNAFGEAQLDLQNIGGLSQSAEVATDRSAEFLTGSIDRAQAAENARQEKKRSRLGLLGKIGGAGIGFLAGGPAGAVTGAKVGSSLFG